MHGDHVFVLHSVACESLVAHATFAGHAHEFVDFVHMRRPLLVTAEHFTALSAREITRCVRVFVSVHCRVVEETTAANFAHIIPVVLVHVFHEQFESGKDKRTDRAPKFLSSELEWNDSIFHYIRMNYLLVFVSQMIKQRLNRFDVFVAYFTFQLSNIESELYGKDFLFLNEVSHIVFVGVSRGRVNFQIGWIDVVIFTKATHVCEPVVTPNRCCVRARQNNF